MLNNYRQAKDFLESFVNYEHVSFFPYLRRTKLRRMQMLLEHLHIPLETLKAVHIAGTKGKGSTANLVSCLLASAGFRVGLYTSPHLFDLRERIQTVVSHKSQVAGRLIPRQDFLQIINEIRPKLKKLKLPKDLGMVSFFEVYTAVAFKYFIKRRVDLAVLETGLGGKLDATNVIQPEVCIITHISYEHTYILGRRLEDIACQKAGIVKKGVPVVCSCQRPAVVKVIKRVCRKKNAPFILLGRDFCIENIRLKNEYTFFDFRFKNYRFKDLKIQLKGKYQAENAACAMAAVVLMSPEINEEKLDNFKRGLGQCNLEGRFEIVSRKPLIVVDIAHNISSFSVLSDNLKFYFPAKRIILIFACSKDKNVRRMLPVIPYSQLIITSFDNPRSFSPQELKRVCNTKGAYLADSVRGAFELAKGLYTKESIIVVSGSLFLVSEAKRYLDSFKSSNRKE